MNRSVLVLLTVSLGSSPTVAIAQPKLKATLKGHQNGVSCVAYSADGKTLVSGGGDKMIQFWDVKTGKPGASIRTKSNVYSTIFSRDGATLASSEAKEPSAARIHLWDVKTSRERFRLEGNPTAVNMYAIAFSPDGKTLVAGSNDPTTQLLLLWDTETGTLRERLRDRSETAPVGVVAYSPDGKTIASGHEEAVILLWDATTGKVRTKLTGHKKGTPVRALAFSPDGKTLASGTSTMYETKVRLWDVETGKDKGILDVGKGPKVVAFSPDGKTLAAVSNLDKEFKLWDVETAQPRTTLKVGSVVTCAAYSPDGKTLALGYRDSMIKLWDVSAEK